MRPLILLACFSLCLPYSLYAEDKPDPRENLDTTIAEYIRLIEAKENVALVKFILPPMKLQRKLQKRTMEELVKEVEPKFPYILKMLKQIQGTKPRVNDAETEAVYEIKEPIDGIKNVTFVKEEKFWYLR